MSAGNFFQTASETRRISAIGFYGHLFGGDAQSITGTNQNPQAKQTVTISVPSSVDNSTAYTITSSSSGAVATYTTDASATQAELGAGLVAAFNAKASLRAKHVASYSGGTITLTATWPNVSDTFTVNSDDTTNDLGTPTEGTAAAGAGVVEFGRVLISDGTVTDEGIPKVFVPTTSSFSAQVITITITTATGATFTPWIKINGKRYDGDAIAHDTDAATTAEAVKDEFNAIAPSETVIATRSTADVVLTAEVEGAEFEAGIIVAGAAATVAKVYTTGPSVSTSLQRAMVGISVRRTDVENQTVDGDDPAYAANEGVEVATRGYMVVQRDTTETWTRGDECFVSVASATKGRIYDTAGTNRIWLPSSRLVVDRSEHSGTTDGLGVVRLNMGA